jgi:hypothetical protein
VSATEVALRVLTEALEVVKWQRLGATIPAAGNRAYIRQTAVNVQIPLQPKHANRTACRPLDS